MTDTSPHIASSDFPMAPDCAVDAPALPAGDSAAKPSLKPKRVRKPASDRVKLNDPAIRSAIASGSRKELIDPTSPGLRIRPMKSGTAMWSVMVRDVTGKNRRFNIGEFPKIGVASARDLAEALRHQVKREGLDPTLIRQQKREAAMQADQPLDPKDTLEGVIDYYGDKVGDKQKDWKVKKARIKLVFGQFFAREARLISRAELQKAAVDWRAVGTANTAVRYLRPILKWSSAMALVKDDTVLLKEPGITEKRDKFLDKGELLKVLPVLRTREWEGKRSMHAVVMLFILYTACRLNEACDAKWAEIVDGVWTIPGKRIKDTRKKKNQARKAHVVPLSRQAVQLIEAIKPEKPKPTDLVFPNELGQRLSNWDRVQKSIHKASGVSGWHRHDLRRTAATWLGERGIPPHIIEAALNHVDVHSELASIYNRARYENEVGDAFQVLGDWIDLIEEQKRNEEEAKLVSEFTEAAE